MNIPNPADKWFCVFDHTHHPLKEHAGRFLHDHPNALFVDLRTIDPKVRLKELEKLERPWIADLTTGVLPEFQALPFYRGSFAGAIYSPQNCYEASSDLALEFLNDLKLKGLKSPGHPIHSFTFPRILSMLFLEAQMANTEKLATPSAMDLAVQLGVNYPMGLFEWMNQSAPNAHSILLQHLKNETKEDRYQSPI